MRIIMATLLLVAVTSSVVSAQSRNQNQSWMNGTWEGTGYQIDNNSTWTIRLTVNGNRYRIEYPSLKCEGRWIPFKSNQSTARFREILTVGADVCANKGIVVIQRLSPRQLAYRYQNQGEADVSSSSILNRKK